MFLFENQTGLFENCSFPHTLSRGIWSIGTYCFTSDEITAIIGKLAVDYK